MNTRELRVVFNTRGDPNVGSTRIPFQHVRRALRPMVACATLNDWDHYEDYDVAILSTPDREVERARACNPDLVIGLTKLCSDEDGRAELARADFLIADSRFQRDLYLSTGRPIVTLRLVETNPGGVRHTPHHGPFTPERPALIAHHGNLLHLEQLGGPIGRALEAVSRQIPLRLRAIYDMKGLGRWEKGRPQIDIEDLQWTWETIHTQLAECDLGIVPNFVPSHEPSPAAPLTYCENDPGSALGAGTSDVILRTKSSANAGRVFVFMQLGMPVIACPVPECVEVLEPESHGLTAMTEAGWHDALLTLLEDANERAAMGMRACRWAGENLDPRLEAEKLLRFTATRFADRLTHRPCLTRS